MTIDQAKKASVAVRKFPATFLTLLFTLLASLTAHGQIQSVAKPAGAGGPSFLGYVKDEIIVVLKPGAAQVARGNRGAVNVLAHMPEFAGVVQRFGVTRARQQFPGTGGKAAALPTEQRMGRHFKVQFRGDLEQTLAGFAGHPLVEHVEPIGVHAIYATPNDTYYDDPPEAFPYDQWHYWDTHGVDADLAWNDEAGDPNVVVAVLDTGVRYWHVDLGGPNDPWGPDNPQTNGNIWVNSAEIPGNGTDDDGNGYVDDTIGYDFVANTSDPLWVCYDSDCGTEDNDPSDGEGHGTHVAGTVAAITNNGMGVAGVAGGYSDGTQSGAGNGAKVMSLRIGWRAVFVFTVTGVVRMDYAAEAMNYVATMVDSGVNVAAINCSWGSSNSGGIDAAVDNLLARDVMIIHAAGNSDANDPDYLGSKAGVMNVGATNSSGAASSFSSFGDWVDVAAPGERIVSTFHNPDDPGPDYLTVMDGTSMATPHVCGVAALLESAHPSLSAADKFNIMVNTATPYSGTKYVGSGIVNARNALDAAGPPCDVSASFTSDVVSGCGPLTVNFTDLSSGPVTTWAWDFGDGSTSNVQNPSHEYGAPGNYTVSLTVTSALCADTELQVDYITVLAAPVADFSASPLSGAAPLNVSFTDLSTDNPTSWSWNFGDGTSSLLQHPVHTFANPGVYDVSLTVMNACGGETSTKVAYVEVVENTADVALALSDNPQSGTFTGDYTDTHASDDVQEVITEEESGGKPSKRRSLLEHRWTFDVVPGGAVDFYVEAHRPDNSEGDDFSFEWSADNSEFHPLLMIANSTQDQLRSASLPSTISGTVYVRVVDTDRTQGNRSLDQIIIDHMYIESSGTPNDPPVVSINAPEDGSSLPGGIEVAFAGTASDTEDGDLTASLEWVSSLDGVIGEGGSFTRVLSNGTHTITASVTDSGGKPGSDSITLTIGAPPALIVGVGTDKPSYLGGEIVLITVAVTDGAFPIAGAAVHVEMRTPRRKLYTADATTDLFGIAMFIHTADAKKDGTGTYTLDATASMAGYTDGSGSATFEVTK